MPPEEKVSYARPADLPGIEMLLVENCARRWSHFHVTYSICTPLEAECPLDFSYRGKRHRSSARNVIMLEPGETHQNANAPLSTFQVLFLDPGYVERLVAEAGYGALPHFKVAVVENPDLFQAFVRVHGALSDGAPLLERQSRLADCVGRILARNGERGLCLGCAPARLALRRARDYLHAHVTENISLDDLARLACLSRFHFLRAFAQEFGLPPHAYQVNLRVQRARLLLQHGVPLDEIEAGFADESHLIRHFKRVMGVTPARYAAMIRGGK